MDIPQIITSTFESDFDIFTLTYKWETSDVYSYYLKKNISNETIRKSLSSIVDYKQMNGFHTNIITKININDLWVYKSSSWKAIKYTKDSFFSLHRDIFDKIYDIGTIVIIPPKSICNYTGGELNLYFNEKEFITVIADDIMWMYCIFDYNVYHEVLPVLSGERIIFKNNIILKNYGATNYNRTIDKLFDIVKPIDMTDIKIPKPYDDIYEYRHDYIDKICTGCGLKDGTEDIDIDVDIEMCRVYK